ncbi:5208_t:CDS:2 [Rhizophagus irregularis]|nr:5208_t:CDS:2 [Rhizophagus irregularis]
MESLSLDKTKKTPEIDASRNVNASANKVTYWYIVEIPILKA